MCPCGDTQAQECICTTANLRRRDADTRARSACGPTTVRDRGAPSYDQHRRRDQHRRTQQLRVQRSHDRDVSVDGDRSDGRDADVRQCSAAGHDVQVADSEHVHAATDRDGQSGNAGHGGRRDRNTTAPPPRRRRLALPPTAYRRWRWRWRQSGMADALDDACAGAGCFSLAARSIRYSLNFSPSASCFRPYSTVACR